MRRGPHYSRLALDDRALAGERTVAGVVQLSRQADLRHDAAVVSKTPFHQIDVLAELGGAPEDEHLSVGASAGPHVDEPRRLFMHGDVADAFGLAVDVVHRAGCAGDAVFAGD